MPAGAVTGNESFFGKAAPSGQDRADTKGIEIGGTEAYRETAPAEEEAFEAGQGESARAQTPAVGEKRIERKNSSIHRGIEKKGFGQKKRESCWVLRFPSFSYDAV
jgi:hypothetical protein